MPAWIAVDWGTSRLKAWHVADDGRVLAETATDDGAGRLRQGGFEAALLRAIGGWLDDGPSEILVAGMAGRRGGWREAPYLDLPSDLDALAANRVAVAAGDPRLKATIVPGLCQRRPWPDVMRGEETQLLGLAAREPGFEGRVCLPGTHSKWVDVEGGRAVRFRTFMTGEVFALMATRSILADDVAAGDADGFDDGAFRVGVRRGFKAPETLTAAMFAIRAGGLLGGGDPISARATLSGLLIGAELAAAGIDDRGTVTLVGAQALAARYARAIETLGGRARSVAVEAATLDGLKAIRAAGGGE